MPSPQNGDIVELENIFNMLSGKKMDEELLLLNAITGHFS